jgi:plastocyanin
MKRKNAINVFVALIVVFYLAVITFTAEGKKEELEIDSKIVVLKEFEGAVPATLTSKVGTTVIWVNYSQSPVKLLFTHERVIDVCHAPVNFFVGKDGTYESAKIPFGGTASLCFKEKGRYEFIIKVLRPSLPQRHITRDDQGTILIK